MGEKIKLLLYSFDCLLLKVTAEVTVDMFKYLSLVFPPRPTRDCGTKVEEWFMPPHKIATFSPASHRNMFWIEFYHTIYVMSIPDPFPSS